MQRPPATLALFGSSRVAFRSRYSFPRASSRIKMENPRPEIWKGSLIKETRDRRTLSRASHCNSQIVHSSLRSCEMHLITEECISREAQLRPWTQLRAISCSKLIAFETLRRAKRDARSTTVPESDEKRVTRIISSATCRSEERERKRGGSAGGTSAQAVISTFINRGPLDILKPLLVLQKLNLAECSLAALTLQSASLLITQREAVNSITRLIVDDRRRISHACALARKRAALSPFRQTKKRSTEQTRRARENTRERIDPCERSECGPCLT